MDKQAVKKIVDALGSEAIASRLEVTEHSVRHAKREGRFSASWFLPLREMCEEADVQCPEHLFNWRVPQASNGDAA